MTLSELGQKLKQEREAQGITLEQLHQKTRISLHILQAIEEGDTSLLPHPVYAKGFVQNYARNLGLDWKEIGDQFASLYNVDNELENLEELPASLKAKLERKTLYKYSRIIVLIVLLITLVALFWLAISSFFSSKKDAQRIEQNSSVLEEKQESYTEMLQNGSEIINDFESQNSSSLISNSSNETVGNETNETIVNENAIEVNATNASKNNTLEVQNDVIKNNVVKNNQNIEKKVALKNTKDLVKQNTVVVYAIEPCWFETVIDDKQKEFYLRPGQKIILTFTNFLRLRLGNAGGVKLKYNGQDYPLQARSGQVKTLIFREP